MTETVITDNDTTDEIAMDSKSETIVDQQSNQTGEAALVSVNSYYKSKVLNISHGINPLVTASSSIFSIVQQCYQLNADSDLEQIQRELVHEMHAFECQAQQHTYQEKTLLAARFALCAFIDERIHYQLGDEKIKWQPFLMLKRFHGQEWGGEQFYILLERSSADPSGYIDLLELFYLCLSFGYQGKYVDMDHGFIIRENIVNRLYQTIREQRGEFSKNVLIADGDQTPATTPVKKSNKSLFAVSFFAVFTVFCITAYQYTSMQNANDSIQQTMSNFLHKQQVSFNTHRHRST